MSVTGSTWKGLPDAAKIWDHCGSTPIVRGDVASDIGDARAALERGSHKFAATYDFAIQTGGSIGPSFAVVQFVDRGLSGTASQATHDLRKQLAPMLDLADADVRCIYLEGAGCHIGTAA
jgi:nicotinate dehydrogenase subunit B